MMKCMKSTSAWWSEARDLGSFPSIIQPKDLFQKSSLSEVLNLHRIIFWKLHPCTAPNMSQTVRHIEIDVSTARECTQAVTILGASSGHSSMANPSFTIRIFDSVSFGGHQLIIWCFSRILHKLLTNNVPLNSNFRHLVSIRWDTWRFWSLQFMSPIQIHLCSPSSPSARPSRSQTSHPRSSFHASASVVKRATPTLQEPMLTHISPNCLIVSISTHSSSDT